MPAITCLENEGQQYRDGMDEILSVYIRKTRERTRRPQIVKIPKIVREI